MNKRIKKKKHHDKSFWQLHMYFEYEASLRRIAKMCMCSVYGKCIGKEHT